MLKIAGVKSEKEFYKKFPTEEAFMAKHGNAFKKAQIGAYMTSGEAPIPYTPLNVAEMYSDVNYTMTGMTDAERRQLAALQANEQSSAKKGKKIPKAQPGFQQFASTQFGFQGTPPPPTGNLPRIQIPTAQQLTSGMPSQTITPSATPTATKGAFNAMPYVESAADIIQGIQMLKAEKDALDQARQQEQLTGVFAQAAASRPVQQPRRQYVRPEDVILQPEQMFPSYGVGTNVLAQNGAMIGGNPTEIMNVYNPGTMYTDLGYEPLNDSNKMKNFKKGGELQKAKLGNQNWMKGTQFADIMGNQGGAQVLTSLGEYATGGPDGGSKVGKGIGSAAGTALFGPVGGMVGGALGSFIGGALDQKQEKIEAANERRDQNVSKIVGQSTGMAIQNMNRSFMQDGGKTSPYAWMSHTWQPQVITTFGEHKVKDLLKPPADADMLRAGGHLKEYTPPSARAMFTGRPEMQMGGELQTHWGGYAEPMSYNPYLPDGGETIMFRGQSHDESDGQGNTGIGITYGDNPVEVERGEPAVKLQDGTTGDSSLTVFGNIKITNAFADMLADPKAKGKKFKTYVADLSKQENKQNKLIDKSVEQLDNLDVQTSFDKLALGTMQANIEGANAKLKDLAQRKMDAAALQNAINDSKEEELLNITDKGDVLAKKGAKIPKAQTGRSMSARAALRNVDPKIQGLFDLLASKNYDIYATSGLRPGAATKQGNLSRHAKGEAMDITFPGLNDKAYDAILSDPDVVRYMLQNDITAINEYDAAAQRATGASGPHIHFGFDKGTPLADKFRNEAKNKYPDALTSISDTGLPGLDPTNYNYLKSLYEEAKKEGRGPAVLKFQQEYHRLTPDYAKSVLGKYPVTSYGKKKGLQVSDLSQNLDSIFGPRTEQYMAALDAGMNTTGTSDTPTGTLAEVKTLMDAVLPPGKKVTKKQMADITVTPYKRSFMMDAFNRLLPFLRPSDIEELDANQLVGEMYALSNNQVEPVWAQKFTPELGTPMDISLQDILNENQATYNATARQVGYNPAALGALNAQKYAANQRVLGEQFRLNQAEKQRVYGENRNLLNQAELQNLQTLERQADKQAMALSKTKATTQAALNSIASKYAQNKLENRTLAVMENMYNYRYDPSFRAMNMNPLWQPNLPEIGSAVPVYDKNNKVVGYKAYEEGTGVQKPSTATAKKGKTVKKNNLNSSIVRALKNI